MDDKKDAAEVERNGVLSERKDGEYVNKTSREYEQYEQISESHEDNLQSDLLSNGSTKENDKIESERNLRRSSREKYQNPIDRVAVESEETYRQMRNLGGCQGRVRAVINQLSACVSQARRPDDIAEILQSLDQAWRRYNDAYGNYVERDLSEEEFLRIEERFSQINEDHARCVHTVKEWIRHHQSKECQTQEKLSKCISRSGSSVSSKTSKSSRLSKGKEAKINAELQRLAATQVEEAAILEAEMQMKKIDIELKMREKVRKVKSAAQLAERKAELLEEDDENDASSTNSSKNKIGLDRFVNTPWLKKERTEAWATSCPDITFSNYADNCELAPRCDEFLKERPEYLQKSSVSKPNQNKTNTKVKKDPITDGCINGCTRKPPEVRINLPQNPQAVMLKVNMLQAMHPVKFDGNPGDFPTFRKRIMDNLEDGLLTDSQMVEFLPKFVSGEAYDVVKRAMGCTYPDIIEILQERYGQPAAVAAACIESLTSGAKLTNGDYKGLRNFAEQMTSATKRLQDEYEQEASTTSNLKLIAGRLPNYLINKWGDVSYSIREKGRKPKLKDLAQFVKRQAAIKNDPSFIGSNHVGMNNDEKIKSGRSPRPQYKERQASTFATDVKKEDEDHINMENNDDLNTKSDRQPRCLCCSGQHKLAFCPEFQRKAVQARWEIIKRHRLCHICMRPGHFREQCKWTNFCSCGSEKRHNLLLHNTIKPKEGKEEIPADNRIATDKKSTEQYATITDASAKTVLLHVLPVKIRTPQGKSVTTYALLDNASRGTMINSEIARELNLRGRTEKILVSTLLQREHQDFEVVDFELQSASGKGEVIRVEDGLVSKKFNISERFLPHDINRSTTPHLADLEIPDVEVKKVSVLIGKDVQRAHEVLEIRKSKKPGKLLEGQRGPLGWVITGTVDDPRSLKEVTVNFTSCDKTLHDQVESFWKLEGFGARGPVTKRDECNATHGPSREDIRAVQILDRTTKMNNGHYETGLLWKGDDIRLPNNRNQAEKRLGSLKRRFQKQPDLEKKYRSVMEDHIKKGYAHKLSAEEALNSGPRTWYLPHFPVMNPNKPTKVRIVFDAAAESDNASLNKNLLQGPDRTNSLVGVLMRFRQENVALVADIESMFHQVKVRREDQDSLRFLWWTEGADKMPDEYVMTVHIFGATDSPCVANSALLKTADDNATEFDPETIKTVKNNFYVDDLLKSLNTTEAAIQLAKELTKLCTKGGFNLTKFTSNDRNVLSSIPAEKRADPNLDLGFEDLPVERALGIRWNLESDTFGFKVVDVKKPDTMRGVLSTICSVFDPLNLAAPAMLTAKQIMQDLWRKKWSWDQPLEGEILQRWKRWKGDLQMLIEITIPRCYYSKPDHEGSSLELHHFCDASEVGYGTSSYLRISYPDGNVECSFVAGKSRNAPIKTVTIPRLELQAAALAARMDKAIRSELELEIKRVVFWTDSMITLNYINNESRRFQTYVSNRITEIHELTTPDQWRHCPGDLNPADDASRGLEMTKFKKNERWLNGPTFLLRPEDEWPKTKLTEVPVTSLEVKKETYLTEVEPTAPLYDLIGRHSKWIDCLRRIAWLQKFTDWMRRKRINPTLASTKEKITLEDLERAKRNVVRLVQRQAFCEETKDIEKNSKVKGSSQIVKLKPSLDENGVLRVGGRISRAPISRDAMNPMILPRKHHVTKILIRYLHEKNGHCGHEQVLAISREQFWIVTGRAAIKETLGRCIKCKKRTAPKQWQEMAELPRVRLIPYEQPFSYTGLDYFGPFYVKRGRGRVTEKRWGAIFTCLNCRAVHLEVAKSLETDDFMMVLIRFLNRRGHVKELRSDNGTNFVGAEREIQEAIKEVDQEKIENVLMQRGCKWVFHPPGAPHMSGVWERLVRTVKRSLKAILGKDLISEEILQTVFTEAEYIANSRPLTRNPSNPDDEEPLTPNHFLNIRPAVNLPPEIVTESDRFSKKKWRQAQLLANHYWKRWLREYIPSLQQRQKWNQKQRNLQVNDLVLIADDNVSRNQWPLGRITNVFPGADGLVRTVDVRSKNSVYRRPVTKLCLLEASDSTEL